MQSYQSDRGLFPAGIREQQDVLCDTRTHHHGNLVSVLPILVIRCLAALIVVGRFSEGLRKKCIDLNLRFQDNMQHVLHEPKNTQHELDEQQLVFQTMGSARL